MNGRPYADDTDPWLPARLALIAAFPAAEEAVYVAYWSMITVWLTRVTRSVIRPAGLPPDPNGVWTHQPEWDESVNRFVADTINPIVGKPFATMLGPGYDYDSRPLVVDHLAGVTNRMVRTPDSVFDLVASQIAAGTNLGEGVPELSERVETVLSTTATERWPNRATVVARTEGIGALNAGRAGAFAAVAEDLDDEYEQMWIATSDNRTRPTHRRADLQRVPVGVPFDVGGVKLRYPGDPAGPAREVIQCRCSTIMVEPGGMIDLSNRQFRNYQ